MPIPEVSLCVCAPSKRPTKQNCILLCPRADFLREPAFFVQRDLPGLMWGCLQMSREQGGLFQVIDHHYVRKSAWHCLPDSEFAACCRRKSHNGAG